MRFTDQASTLAALLAATIYGSFIWFIFELATTKLTAGGF